MSMISQKSDPTSARRLNILITGSKGQLGAEIRELAPVFSGYNFFFTDIDELDITQPLSIHNFLEQNHIDCIINAAGFTAVDQAESESEKAFLVNSTAVGYLAQAARKYQSLLIHLSTDYIFKGNTCRPLDENDSADPISVYGKSKLSGEQMAIQFNPRTVIVRTSWLYSTFGKNFVKTILIKARENKTIRVVYDQIGSPTYAADLAKMILELLPEWNKLHKPEIFHYSNEGVASWYDLAVETIRIAGLDCIVLPIRTSDYPLPAPRPPFSLLSKEKIRFRYGIQIPYWRDSLRICLEKMKSSKALN